MAEFVFKDSTSAVAVEFNRPLEQIASRIHRLNRTWWQDPMTGLAIERNMGEMLMLCVSELAEAMEGHRKNKRDDHLPQYPMVQVEIVDTFIRLFDICGAYGYPIDEIMAAKLEYNAERADHKPENRVKEGGKKY